jgi:cytochrome c-type biogenesis protein CcmH
LIQSIVTALLLALSLSLQAATTLEQFKFDTQRQTDDFRDLLGQMRCLVCQNESLAASNADLAQDLREELYEQVASGKSKQDVIDFMVARYGDFVLYKPPLQRNTLLLWGGPFIILLVGIGVLVRFIRRRPSTSEHLLTEEQRRKAEALLEGKEEQ